MNININFSAKTLIKKLLEHATKSEKKYIEPLSLACEGILSARSTLVSNIVRICKPALKLASGERWFSRLLESMQCPWEFLRSTMIEIAAREVTEDSFIAFDPGDLSKNYAEKMEGIYRVHDGSEGECSNGYEYFSAEVVTRSQERVFHYPIYSCITSAKMDDYVSQNAQICFAIYAILECTQNKGIWLFDRGHDRSVLFKKFFRIKINIRWILRICKNRKMILDSGIEISILDYAKQLIAQQKKDLTGNFQIILPKKTGHLNVVSFSGQLKFDDGQTMLVYIIAVQDVRNEIPVVLMTSMKLDERTEMAGRIFSYYLERWGKEEGYRFEKVFLNLENIRTRSIKSIQNLALLVQLVYLWVCISYKSSPILMEEYVSQVLMYEKPLTRSQFGYYRVAQAMGHRLFELHPERARWRSSLTEVA